MNLVRIIEILKSAETLLHAVKPLLVTVALTALTAARSYGALCPRL